MNVWLSHAARTFTQSVSKFFPNMSKSYEEAVHTLNTLQTNAAVLEKVRAERDQNRHLNLPNTVAFAKRAGLTLEEIDKLNIIHVSGTKGKGSTCAFCESILRAHGYKTGFFSSPHLVEVRERIRINGQPLAKDTFSSYFWETYKRLDNTKEDHGGTMPAYFRFLTIMAFNVFLQEKVDVAIMEVGIGGAFDCTNISRSPVVCGVTSLGLDHVSLLGDTVEKIAWHKAGIFKPGVPAVTVPQPDNSLDVLQDRAKELEVPLSLAPCLDEYSWGCHPKVLSIPGEMQAVNASLALQLADIWIKDHGKEIPKRTQYYKQQLKTTSDEAVPCKPGFLLTDQMTTGLATCKWLGRNQTVRKNNITYYLDGAHTPRSILACVNWFTPAVRAESETLKGKVLKVLMFNSTGERDPETLLGPLVTCGFDIAVFCPNIASNRADQVNLLVTKEAINKRCQSTQASWVRLLSQADSAGVSPASSQSTLSSPDSMFSQESPLKRPSLDDSQSADSGTESCETSSNISFSDAENPHPSFVFSSILDTLNWVNQGRDPDLPPTSMAVSPAVPPAMKGVTHIQVLVTGSLHLVGGVLGLIDPHINEN